MISDEEREALVEALAGFFHTEAGPLDLGTVNALLPVVEQIARHRVAEELRFAADCLTEGPRVSAYGQSKKAWAKRFRFRADQLDSQ